MEVLPQEKVHRKEKKGREECHRPNCSVLFIGFGLWDEGEKKRVAKERRGRSGKQKPCQVDAENNCPFHVLSAITAILV